MIPLFLLFLLILLLILFIPVGIRIINGGKTVVEIEIQPFRFIINSEGEKESKSGQKNKKNTKEILNLVRLGLPYSKITVSRFDVSVFSDKLFSLYTNTAYLGASLYPLISYVGLRSHRLTIKDEAITCTPTDDKAKSTIYIDITFELRLYAVIFVLIKHFLSKTRRKSRAERNKGLN